MPPALIISIFLIMMDDLGLELRRREWAFEGECRAGEPSELGQALKYDCFGAYKAQFGFEQIAFGCNDVQEITLASAVIRARDGQRVAGKR